MKRIVLTIYVLMFAVNSWASALSGELIYLDGEPWMLMRKPIDTNSELYDKLKAALPENRVVSTSNIDGYWACWSVRNNLLCLDSILVDISEAKVEKRIRIPEYNMQQIFKGYYIGNDIVASWLTEDVRVTRGKQIYYAHVGYDRYYEEETILSINYGNIIGSRLYHNRMVIDGYPYPKNPKAFIERLKQCSINVNRYPDLKNIKKIIFQVWNVKNDSLGNIIDCEMTAILRSGDEYNHIETELALEMKKQFMEIGPWQTFYINGEYVIPTLRYTYTFPYVIEDSPLFSPF